ncbi:MAG: chloride channel protein, partial [Candidatus Competibacteraceae bacterium]|nr:chloride channel protein [Candidatus Competibacteraceae bacterium]
MSKIPPSLRQSLTARLETLRLRLADPQAQIPLLILGLVSGAVAGLSMVIFRLVIEASPALLLGADNPEDHEHLTPWWRLILPTLGGLAVGLLLQRLEPARRQVGVVHVLERLSYSEGHLPLSNAGVQFVGAALCILSGHSIGREGPSIHIGAASGSWMGQRLHLPNNSIRILVGCGSAGAIAAAFNTPLAGVIFAMEVILMEYTLTGFVPIIAAAVAATTVSRWAFGQDPVFIAPDVGLDSLADLGYVLIMGVLIGALSAAFFRLLVMITRQFRRIPIWLRATAAGAATGILALWAPQVMGIGYDTVNQALLGELGLGLLLGILAAKLAATSLALGLGLPGGLIGPTLVMGAMAGGAAGLLLDLYAPVDTSPALYATRGMGAMMGATLKAPLAALTALLELTNNPHVIMPGMLAVVAASVTAH